MEMFWYVFYGLCAFCVWAGVGVIVLTLCVQGSPRALRMVQGGSSFYNAVFWPLTALCILMFRLGWYLVED
jgi:hypothetical protein